MSIENGTGGKVFNRQISLGNVLSMFTMILTGASVAIGFVVTYEHRMTSQENAAVYFDRELQQLDRKIDLAIKVDRLSQNIDLLMDQHRTKR